MNDVNSFTASKSAIQKNLYVKCIKDVNSFIASKTVLRDGTKLSMHQGIKLSQCFVWN